MRKDQGLFSSLMVWGSLILFELALFPENKNNCKQKSLSEGVGPNLLMGHE